MKKISLHCGSFLPRMKNNPTLNISQVSTKRETGSLKRKTQYAAINDSICDKKTYKQKHLQKTVSLVLIFGRQAPPPSYIPSHSTLSALIGSPSMLDRWSPLDVLPGEHGCTMKFPPPWHQWESLIGEPFHKGMFSEPGYSNIWCTGTQ